MENTDSWREFRQDYWIVGQNHFILLGPGLRTLASLAPPGASRASRASHPPRAPLIQRPFGQPFGSADANARWPYPLASVYDTEIRFGHLVRIYGPPD